jgi:sugar fermentation stimulation protein A
MINLLKPGAKVCFSKSENPKRKLNYTIEGIYIDNQWIHTNTIKANKVVFEALVNGKILEFPEVKNIKREYSFGSKRIDFYFETKDSKILLEVKSVSLFDDEYAMFPDAKTQRGLEHLKALLEWKKIGYSPYILYLIQSNRKKFRCADKFDKAYCEFYHKVVPKYITPLFYHNIFDPYKETNEIERIETK